MNENIQELVAKVCGWIRSDEHGYYYSTTRFDNLDGGAAVTAMARGVEAGPEKGLARHAHFLHQDWTNILTIITKLAWMRDLVRTGALHRDMWMHFAASDIDMFHVEVRSACDHLARVISCLSNKRGQVRETSYDGLLAWTARNEHRARELLGDVIIDSVMSSRAWFPDMKAIREETVHYGGFNLVFPADEGILFQVIGRDGNSIARQGVMYNKNVVDFQRYSSLATVRLWALAEDTAQEAFQKLRLSQLGLGEGSHAYNAGLKVLRKWSAPLLEGA